MAGISTPLLSLILGADILLKFYFSFGGGVGGQEAMGHILYSELHW